ncbi:MAG TPA: acyl carrier protein [Gammaproteobacteria bacterium]|nr:acyl carrier protein [Gammaproteobacteria bacterium]
MVTTANADINSVASFEHIKSLLVENFELDPDSITPQSRLYEDLDLDSIDAVDMVIKLQDETGKRIKPEDFKDVRTVDDIMQAVQKLLAA